MFWLNYWTLRMKKEFVRHSGREATFLQRREIRLATHSPSRLSGAETTRHFLPSSKQQDVRQGQGAIQVGRQGQIFLKIHGIQGVQSHDFSWRSYMTWQQNPSRLKNLTKADTQEWGNHAKAFKVNTKSMWGHTCIHTYVLTNLLTECGCCKLGQISVGEEQWEEVKYYCPLLLGQGVKW